MLGWLNRLSCISRSNFKHKWHFIEIIDINKEPTWLLTHITAAHSPSNIPLSFHLSAALFIECHPCRQRKRASWGRETGRERQRERWRERETQRDRARAKQTERERIKEKEKGEKEWQRERERERERERGRGFSLSQTGETIRFGSEWMNKRDAAVSSSIVPN